MLRKTMIECHCHSLHESTQCFHKLLNGAWEARKCDLS